MEGLTKTELVERFGSAGVSPSKALGQSFLVDSNLADRIARNAVQEPGTHVVEVGPGAGSLTLALAQRSESVMAIEMDRYIIPVLMDVLGSRMISNVSVLRQDVMDFSWTQGLVLQSYTLAANLPYNISATLIVRLLEEVPAISRMVVMVQEEVGRRIAARPGTKEYSSVSVKVDFWATARVLFTVPPSVFYPRPNVNSAVVEIVRRPSPEIVEPPVYSIFSTLVRSGFSSRRQMMRRSLSGIADQSVLESVGIEPTDRAETLSYLQFLRLAERVYELREISVERIE